MIDLRQQRRFPTDFLATWEDTAACKSGDGVVENIGMGGCKIRTLLPSALGTEMMLTLFLPRHGLLAVQGIVRWQVGYDMGLQFIRLESMQLQWLHRFMEALAGATARSMSSSRAEWSDSSPSSP